MTLVDYPYNAQLTVFCRCVNSVAHPLFHTRSVHHIKLFRPRPELWQASRHIKNWSNRQQRYTGGEHRIVCGVRFIVEQNGENAGDNADERNR